MRLLPVLAAATLIIGAVTPMTPENSDPEDQLKAATVLAILQHTTWRVEDRGDPGLAIGVWGRPQMAETLRRTLDGKVINGRGVRVLPLTGQADVRCCRVLYVATDRKPETQKLLTAAAGRALTIGETDRFLDQGGALNLFLSDGHMAFEVSLEAIELSGVTISAKLLRFGRVRGKPKGATK